MLQDHNNHYEVTWNVKLMLYYRCDEVHITVTQSQVNIACDIHIDEHAYMHTHPHTLLRTKTRFSIR